MAKRIRYGYANFAKYYDLPYGEFTEFLQEMPRIKKALSVPHFTIIQKALPKRYLLSSNNPLIYPR